MSQGNGDSPASVILYFQGPQNINGAGDRIDRQEKQHDYDVALAINNVNNPRSSTILSIYSFPSKNSKQLCLEIC